MKTLLIVDIENLCEETRPSEETISIAKEFLDVLARVDKSRDQYVIGCHHTLAPTVRKVWKESNSANWELVVKSGENGADIALGSWLFRNKKSLANFKSIVIASGDNFFAEEKFVKGVYKKFNPNYILQVASNSTSASYKFDSFQHHVAYFSDVHSSPVNSISLLDARSATERYRLIGREYLGQERFYVPHQPDPVSKMITSKLQAKPLSERLRGRKLAKDGVPVQFEVWSSSYNHISRVRLYLNHQTAEKLSTLKRGDKFRIDLGYESLQTFDVL